MKMYVFCHTWLSGIQRGIQGAHAIAEMVAIKCENKSFQKLFTDWAFNHKTMVFLNGGGSNDLDDLYTLIVFGNYTHFTSKFEEDDSLAGATTAVALLLPDYESNGIDSYRKEPYHNREEFLSQYNEETAALIKKIAGYKLA